MTDIPADNAAIDAPRPMGTAAMALAALVAAAVIQTGDFAGGAAGIGGDNDSLMRMTMVRDLMAGQGWFDPMQYRMGLEGGFAMHWSRLVDAPLAAVTLAGAALTGSRPAGEAVAMLIWPSLLLAASVFLIMRIATKAHGAAAFLPSLVTGAAALASTGIFTYGAVDHHNLQVTLTLVMLTGLLGQGFAAAALAGCAAAAMAAVGAEALPYVAAGGLIAGGLWLARGDEEADVAKGFGIGFAVTAAACFVSTVPPQAWMRPACDAFSIAQAGVAVPAGLGLAAAVVLGRGRGPAARLGALALLGALLATIVIAAFPQCLADPYAGLDPRLRRLWLDAVVEAQPAAEILARDPAMFMGWYATPLLALGVLVWRGRRMGWTRAGVVVGAALVAAVAVSLWQIRGALFALPLAAIVLAGWIARARAAHAAAGTCRTLLAMAAAWVLSFGAIWGTAADAIVPDTGQFAGPGAAEGASGSECEGAGDYVALASMPTGTVLAPSNLGAKVLAYTAHRALAGPYHRNIAGNLAALDMLMVDPGDAGERARAAGVTLVAFCPGDSETSFLAEAAPGGLLAHLAGGRTPAWLQPASVPGATLTVYRVHFSRSDTLPKRF